MKIHFFTVRSALGIAIHRVLISGVYGTASSGLLLLIYFKQEDIYWLVYQVAIWAHWTCTRTHRPVLSFAKEIQLVFKGNNAHIMKYGDGK